MERNKSVLWYAFHVPKKPGKYPVILEVPGAGVSSVMVVMIEQQKGLSFLK